MGYRSQTQTDRHSQTDTDNVVYGTQREKKLRQTEFQTREGAREKVAGSAYINLLPNI